MKKYEKPKIKTDRVELCYLELMRSFLEESKQ